MLKVWIRDCCLSLKWYWAFWKKSFFFYLSSDISLIPAVKKNIALKFSRKQGPDRAVYLYEKNKSIKLQIVVDFLRFWYSTKPFRKNIDIKTKKDSMKSNLELETTRHMKNCTNFLRGHEKSVIEKCCSTLWETSRTAQGLICFKTKEPLCRFKV